MIFLLLLLPSYKALLHPVARVILLKCKLYRFLSQVGVQTPYHGPKRYEIWSLATPLTSSAELPFIHSTPIKLASLIFFLICQACLYFRCYSIYLECSSPDILMASSFIFLRLLLKCFPLGNAFPEQHIIFKKHHLTQSDYTSRFIQDSPGFIGIVLT